MTGQFADDGAEVISNMPTHSQVPPNTSEVQTPEIPPSNPGCFVCGKLEPVKKCGKCRKVQYCSPECQKADWKMHKEICNKKTNISEEEGDEEEEDEDDEDSEYDYQSEEAV